MMNRTLNLTSGTLCLILACDAEIVPDSEDVAEVADGREFPSTGAQATTAPMSDHRPITDFAGAKAVRLPFSTYLERAPGDELLVHRAQQELIASCMRDRGFLYSEVAPVPRIGSDWSVERRYGLADKQQAESHGYRQPEAVLAADEASPGQPTTSPELHDALIGSPRGTPGGNVVPGDGCLGIADSILRGDNARYWDLMTRAFGYAHEAYERAKSSITVQDAQDEWAECLRTRGFEPGEDPTEMDRSFSIPEDGSGMASVREIQTAVADVDCKFESQYLVSYFRSESREELRALDVHADELRELQNLREGEVDRAADVLAGRLVWPREYRETPLKVSALAQIQAALSHCGPGYWCYWSSYNWTPYPPGKWSGSATNYDQSGWANRNLGFYNHGTTGRGVKWWTGRNYSGTYLGCVNPGYGNHTTYGWAAYKNAESHKWASYAYQYCSW